MNKLKTDINIKLDGKSYKISMSEKLCTPCQWCVKCPQIEQCRNCPADIETTEMTYKDAIKWWEKYE